MDTFGIFDISAAGMSLERQRLETSALNLANAHTTVGPDGVRYRPLQVVARPNAMSFDQLVGGAARGNIAPLHDVEIRARADATRQVYDPGHPNADEKGFVAYPNVNPVSETLSLISITNSYDANVRVMNAAKTMALKALDIGGDR